MAQVLSTKRKQILDCISEAVRERGYPPSVREIGESVGLTSSMLAMFPAVVLSHSWAAPMPLPAMSREPNRLMRSSRRRRRR